MFNVFRTKKPVSKNKSQLVAVTSDKDRAVELMDDFNRSPLKNMSVDKNRINGNHEVTEIFSHDELKQNGWGKTNAEFDAEKPPANGDIPA